MNKHLYRVIFNKARGLLVVVAEIARAQGKVSGNDNRGKVRQHAQAQPLLFALPILPISIGFTLGSILFIVNPAHADIIADKYAPKNQQATVLNTGNGHLLVNIQTPSAAGVSRNAYSALNVPQEGAVFNNSRTNVQTQLGGWVQGNPWLATGSARIILNEVNSSLPSVLQGYMEVAGQRAQMVIVNPSGISCDGCGFINTSRGTLTTGAPILSGGSLQGYRVQRGVITIQGNGLDASQTDYTNIIARAVQVNAGVWANELNISTGTNEANTKNTIATPISASTAKPDFALDVSNLGGMYAGKIRLIGTEAGVGVRNAGAIGASAGGFTLSAEGSLENTGSISSSDSTQITLNDTLSNTGTIYAQSTLSLTTQGNIINSGVIAAKGNANLNATGANSLINSTTNSILAAGLNANGLLVPTSAAKLNIQASRTITAQGQNLAANTVKMFAETIDISHSQTVGNKLQFTASNGDIDARHAVVTASTNLTAQATQSLITDDAAISALELTITAHDISNVAGEIIQTGTTDLSLKVAGNVDNSQGHIASNAASLTIAANSLTNTDGVITHVGSSDLTIHANTLSGTKGEIKTNGSLAITATTAILDQGTTVGTQVSIDSATLSNKRGEIIQTGTATTSINATNTLDNSGGSIASNANSTYTVGKLNNQGGIIKAASDGNLTINATADIDNSDAGLIQAAGDAILSTQRLINQSGNITAGQTLTVTSAQDINNTSGTIASNEGLSVNATAIANISGSLASVHADTSLNATAGAIDNTLGTITAAQSLMTSSVEFNNTKGTLLANDAQLNSQSLLFINSHGTIITTADLALQSGTLLNDAGLIQTGTHLTIDTHGQRLANSNSGTSKGILSQGRASLTTGNLTNQTGYIGAKETLTVTSEAINNTNGMMISEEAISLDGSSLNNQAGQIEALGNLDSHTVAALNNQSGLLRSGQTLTLTAATIDNRTSQGSNQGIEGQDIAMSADSINNRFGAMRADNVLSITDSGSLNNSQGLISSSNTLTIVDRLARENSNVTEKTLAIINTGGTLIAGSNLNIDSMRLTGDGKVLSTGDLTTKLTRNYTHTGEWQADHNATFVTTGIVTNQAKLLAGDTLDITASKLNNQFNAEISADTTILHISSTLTNRGLINGQDTFIDTATLNNIGTGRIYGDHVAIKTTTLNNTIENGTAAVIAARDRLDLGATTITNQEHALLFSADDMAIGGSLDVNHEAIGQGASINNNSATIEALGNLDINVAIFNNTNDHFSMNTVLSSSTTFSGFDMGRWCSSLYTMPGCTGNWLEDFTKHTYTRTIYDPVVNQSDPGKILAGGNMTLFGNTLTNDKSQIITGGTLNSDLVNLNNIGAEGIQTTTLSDQYRVFQKFEGYISAGTNNISTTSTVTIPVGEVQKNTAPTGTGTQVSTPTTGSVTETATGAGSASTKLHNSSQKNIIIQINTVRSTTNDAAVIRTSPPNITVPNNSLYRSNPDLAKHYLIETDPAFANYKTWLSSDYLLSQLSIDPATTQKRLGDGFYEQKLIREQVAQLTGRRFLEGYSSDEDEYRALLEQGATFAKAHQLVPGISLSESQMAELTSDIVWLVEKTVTLANGSTQQVLVPQVYVRLKEGDIDGTGTLLTGDNVKLHLTGDLTNHSGTIAGRSIVLLTADNIKNINGRIAGNSTELIARTDINNIGGIISGDDVLSATAGRNINIETTTSTANNITGTAAVGTRFSRTTIDRVAGLYVTNPNGILVASAGNDLNLLAAELVNSGTKGQTQLTAGHDLNLATVTTAKNNSQTWDARTYSHRNSSREVGTTIQTNGDLSLSANHDLTARAANVTSTAGAISATAGNDLTITSGIATRNEDTARYKKKSGFLSSSRKYSRNTLDEQTAIVSTFSSDTITLQAEHDLTVSGSNVVATDDVRLSAANNVTIESAEQMHDETHVYKKSKSGLMSSGGIGFTIGSQKLATTNDTQNITNLSSTIGSTDGNVNINAGKTYTQSGSDVLAPVGDINITAQQLNIIAAEDTGNHKQTTKFKQSGLTLALTSPVISAVQTAQQMSKAASQTDDTRMKALAAGTAALALNNAYDGVVSGQGTSSDVNLADNVGGINISISVGSSKSESTTTQTSSTVVSSTIMAGGNVNITATGVHQDSDINIIGSTVSAGNNIHLIADDEINLLAAQNTASLNSDNESSSASVGVGLSLGGASNGFTINLGVSGARGDANGDDSVHTNTAITAGNRVHTQSGTDTNLTGAKIEGEQVIMDVGTNGHGNLTIESLQDKHSYDSEQDSFGVGVSLCIPPFCYGASSANVSASSSDVAANYASVNEQSGIKSGEGGFQINVAGNTDLKGAVIASKPTAIDNNKNSLSTQTLTVSDIQNKVEASSDSSGISLSSDMLTQGKYGKAKALISNALDNAEEEQQAQSITLSAISQGNITITDDKAQQALTGETVKETLQNLNRNTTETNNKLEKIDHYTMEERVEANRVIKRAVYQQAEKFTLESYRALFLKDHPLYELSRDEEGNRVLTKLTSEEAKHLKKGSDDKVHIAANGIFNGKEGEPEAAGKYAEQHQTGDGPQYLIHFPEADNMVSELLIAGYMKFLANDFWGFSNSTAKFVDAGKKYGQDGLHLGGHSRGGMTIGNALEILSNDENNKGQLSGFTINLFASAYNVNEADKLLADLQNRADLSPEQKQQAMIRYQSHEYDFVSRVLGQNPSTGGVAPEGSSQVQEWLNVMFGGDTVHNSYSTEQGRQVVSVNDDDAKALEKKSKKYWNSKLPKLVPVSTIE